MRAAPSYCRAGRCASGAAGRGTARALQLGVSVRRPGRARGVRRANFYAETRTRRPRCDLETARPVGVLVLEDDEGGGACASEPAPRGSGWSSARSPRRPAPSRGSAPAPPAVPPSERMNQPRPGARPPRFLFSFSTPRAAGAALHRRGFPGTLPLTPLSAPRGPGPSSTRPTKRLPVAAARPGPQRPSPQPRGRPPRRLAAASPRAARRRSLGSPAGEERARARVTAGLRWVCARGVAENPAWSARGARGGPGAHARPRTCPARTPSSCGAAAPAGVSPKARASSSPPLTATGDISRETRRAAQTRLCRTRATVSEGLGFRVFEPSFLRV